MCDHFEELISARLDDALTPEELRELETHLRVCPRCRSYAREMQRIHEALLSLAADPPEGMLDALMETLPPRKPKKRRLGWAVCAAALALVLLLPPLLPQSDGDTAAGGAASQASTSTPSEADDILMDTETAQAETQEAAAPPLFTQEDARTFLETRLALEDREDLLLTPEGLGEDGSWLFSAQSPDGSPAALFSVSQAGIRELPAVQTEFP